MLLSTQVIALVALLSPEVTGRPFIGRSYNSSTLVTERAYNSSSLINERSYNSSTLVTKRSNNSSNPVTRRSFNSTLISGRSWNSSEPLDIIPRDKSYAVVNVGGDSSTAAPSTATSMIETTRTVEVVSPGETVTQEVTATVLKPEPVPAPTTSFGSSTCTSSKAKSSSSITSTPASSTPTTALISPTCTSTPTPSVSSPTSTSVSTPIITSSASSSISTPVETPAPVFITVTVSEGDGPTEYYDDGMWHTSYRVKTFESVAVATATPSAA